MSFALFLLLVVTFPIWFPVVALPMITIGLLWMVGYPLACTGHWLWMRLVHKKSVPWQLLYPKQ